MLVRVHMKILRVKFRIVFQNLVWHAN